MYVVPEWVERHCIVPDGFAKGRPFRLYRYQLDYLSNFYLVRGDAEWVPEHPVLAPAFVYRRGLLVGPQKLGKDPLEATQLCVEGVGPALFAGFAGRDEGYVCRDHGCRCGWEYAYDVGEPRGMSWPTPLIQITAFSEESTENTYGALRPMIEDGPLADIIPKTGEDFIRLPGGGRIDTVTSSARSRLGQRVTHVSQGEVGIWTKANKMQAVADTQYRGLAGMGGRAALNTNAWDPGEDSVAQQQYESKASDIYRQFIQPPKTLSYANKAERRKIHRIVYPPDVLRENGGHLPIDGIEAEAADLFERDPPQAMRFYGNMLVAGSGAAVDPEVWDALARPGPGMPAVVGGQKVRGAPPPAGARIGAGFDGSVSRDSTYLRGCTADGYGFLIDHWERPQGDEMVLWQTAHPGELWQVPRLEVHAAIARMFDNWSVGLMEVDQPFWRTEAEQWARDYGEEVVILLDTNQPRRFGITVDRWLTGISQGTHTHDGDPATSANVKSARLRKVKDADGEGDARAQYVLVKGEDRRRIDAAISDALAYEAAMTMPAAVDDGPWAYEDPEHALVLIG